MTRLHAFRDHLALGAEEVSSSATQLKNGSCMAVAP